MVSFLHKIDPTRPVTGGFNLMIISSAKKGKGIYDEDGGGRDESGDKAMQGINSTIFNMVTNMVGTGMNKAANSKKADEATSPLSGVEQTHRENTRISRYVWLPIEWDCDKPILRWRDKWKWEEL